MPFKKAKTITVYSRVKLEKMTREDLNITALRWGLTPHDGLADADLVDEIITQQASQIQEMTPEQRQHIANPDAVDEANAQNPVPIMGIANPKFEPEKKDESERIWLRIASGSTALEKADVFMALNGDSCLVKRGEWVKIKRKFLPLLEDAIITQVEVGEDEEKLLRHVPRFNIAVRTLQQGLPKAGAKLSSF